MPAKDRPEIDRFLQHLRARWNLRRRAVKVLAVILRDADEAWWYAGSEPDLAAASGLSESTVSRAIADLENTGLLTGQHRAGRAKRYRVRIDVMQGEVSLPGALEQRTLRPQKPRYRVHFLADGRAELRPADPGQKTLLTPVSSGADPGQNDPIPPPHTIPPRNEGRINPSFIPQLPSLPVAVYDDGLTDGQLCDAMRAWWNHHKLTQPGHDPDAIMGAVLAARHFGAKDAQSYVARCLENGVAQNWRDLARAVRLRTHKARSESCYSPHGTPS